MKGVSVLWDGSVIAADIGATKAFGGYANGLPVIDLSNKDGIFYPIRIEGVDEIHQRSWLNNTSKKFS